MTSGDACARLVASSTAPSPNLESTTPRLSVKYAASPTAAAAAMYGDRDRPPMGNVSLTCGVACVAPRRSGAVVRDAESDVYTRLAKEMRVRVPRVGARWDDDRT